MRHRSDLGKPQPSRQHVRPFKLLLALTAVMLGALLASPASAQTVDDVIAQLDDTGQFSEFTINSELQSSIERANNNGIAFAWIDNDGEDAAEEYADQFLSGLEARNSQYRTVVVLGNDSAWVASLGDGAPEAGQAALSLFAGGANAAALDVVVDTMTGSSATATTAATNSPASTTSTSTSSSSSGGGSGLGSIIMLGLFAMLAFFGIRWFLGRSKAKKQEVADIAIDRAEIQEQLKANADLVIDLGDRVIASGDQELIRSYEAASSQYQEVSTTLNDANTTAEIDRLDELIDDAEWRFLTIEAKLEGRPAPVRPLDEDDPPPPSSTSSSSTRTTGGGVPPLGNGTSSGPALGRDESVLGNGRTTSRTTTRTRTTSRSRGRSSGGMGGMLGGVLGSILMGQVNKRTSRRTQQRTVSRSNSGGSVLRGGSGVSGLGGGVLRRDGGSSRPSNTGRSSNRRSGGGGGFSSRRSGGGGGFGG